MQSLLLQYQGKAIFKIMYVEGLFLFSSQDQ